MSYSDKNIICDLFMKKEEITKRKANQVWNDYVKFMVI